MEGPQCVCHLLHTHTATVTLFHFSFHTDSHLPLLFHLLFSPWMTWLPYPASCSFTSWYKNKLGGGLAVSLCSSGLSAAYCSTACCSRCSKLHRPHCSPLARAGCLQLLLKGWDFIDAQSAFLHGQHAQNYTALLQFQHTRILLGALFYKTTLDVSE